MNETIRSAALGLLLVCLACESSEAPLAAVRDSAGVQIVTSNRPGWGEDHPWTVSRDPILSVGSVGGDAALAFDRLSGVYLLPDDQLAVLDEGAGQIRFFDLEGTAGPVFGRSGQGPGEFQGLTFVGFSRDSLWVFDGRQQRLTVLDPGTRGFRVARVAVDNAALGPAGLLPDGSVILAADLAFSSVISEELPTGLQRFEAAYVRIGSDGALQDTVLITEGSERVLTYGPQAVQMLRPIFARSVSHATRDSDIIQGAQDAYQIGIYSEDGTLRTLIRRSDVDPQLDQASYDAAVEERVLAAPEPARPGLRFLYQEQPRPERRPAYSRFLVDSEGFLWVQDFSYEGEASSWAIYDSEGSWLGSVELPDGFRPTQILGDRVVGIWRDELDVEYARIYEVTRR